MKHLFKLGLLFIALLSLSACRSKEEGELAVYLGVKDYGTVTKDSMDQFQYQFEIDGETVDLTLGSDSSDLRNNLKRQHEYRIVVEDSQLISAQAVETDDASLTPAIQANPGEKSLLNLIKTALMPMGRSLYVYGGGWNFEDDGSSIQSRTIGLSNEWGLFFNAHDADYNYQEEDPSTSYFPYGGFNEYYFAGLDCSGYLGWVLYNTMHSESLENDGYVMNSDLLAKYLGEQGYGDWTQTVTTFKPGDIMSINGHVWLSLGTMSDGSVLIAHSSPTPSRNGKEGGGVQLSALAYVDNSQAYQLADRFMSQYAPEWYERYGVQTFSSYQYSSFSGTDAGQFRWNTSAQSGLSDEEGVQDMTPDQVLKLILNW